MDDPLLMRMLERIASLHHPTDGLFLGDDSIAGEQGQVGTDDEVHDDEIRASRGATEPLGPDDVRMTQPGDRAGLADESPDHPRMVQEGFPEEFHGDITSLAVLMRLVNLSHPPRPDQPSQQEVVVREQEDLGVRIGRSSRRGVS